MVACSSLSPTQQHQVLIHALSRRRLELILLPTEKCNFRCTYCYEDFKIGRMRPEVVKGVKNLISRRVGDLHTLHIQWFGGEPLAAKSIVLDVSQHARGPCTDHHVRLATTITTNASLLRAPLLAELSRLYDLLNFQITLDGDPEQHDKTRLRADGRGSFAAIWKNLLMMRDSDHEFHVQLRLHQGPANESSMIRLIGILNDEFAEDPRFGIYFHQIEDLGGPPTGSIPLLTDEQYRERIKGLKGISKVPVTFDPEDTSQNVCQYICYAAKPNAFIIRATGRISKCTVILGDDRNDIGKLNEDGTVVLDRVKQLPWIAGLETMDMAHLQCPLHYLPSASAPGVTEAKVSFREEGDGAPAVVSTARS